MALKYLLACSLVLLSVSGCSSKKNQSPAQGTVVLALSGDLDTFNPLFTTDATAQEIVDLLYPALILPVADTARGTLSFTPSLARSYEFSNDHRDLTFHLHTDARWSDSVVISAIDVKYSFQLYADPEIGSVHQDALHGLLTTPTGAVDIEKSIVVVNDSTILFHFARAYPSQLFDLALPIFPAHIYKGIAPAELRTHAINNMPVTAGPFRLVSWKPMQEIVLQSDPLCVLPAPASIDKLVFRIIPDPHAQLAQLRNHEVDMIFDLDAADAADLQRTNADIAVVQVEGRRYHFIGWNNIDQAAYTKSKGKIVQPHPLFGSARTRLALTYAINRTELLATLLSGYGNIANGPVAPSFRWAYDESIAPYPFDPTKALQLLAQDGWTDTDNDGILEKNGKKFSFELYTPTGSKFWADIATVVQKELRDVKIEMKTTKADRAIYWQDLINKKYDAWIAGFEVPMELNLEGFWGSDLKKNPFNIFSYRNARVDTIVNTASFMTDQTAAARSWKDFQQIVHTEQPCTFLFWENRLVAFNKKIHGTEINRLHTIRSADKWTVSERN
jgi:peptide/nickel transport system substrate-binding protein